MNTRFWELADRLVAQSRITIDRPRGSTHPRYPESEYPLDYGYLDGTTTMDGGGIDLWRGSLLEQSVTGVIITIDVVKRDAELKLLVGCTAAEAELAMATHQAESQAGLLIMRDAGE